MRALHELISHLPLSEPKLRRRAWPLAAGAVALALVPLSAQAGEMESGPAGWGIPTSALEGCAGTSEQGGSIGSSDVGCFVDLAFSSLADVALDLAEEQGQAQFGEHFQIDRRLGFAASGGEGFSADVDVVIPMHAFASSADETTMRSFFMQNGVTRWRDEHGFQRNDMRLGAVHRHALSEAPGAAAIGTWMFVQENLERGHRRVVSGVEYLDSWGQGTLSHYLPVTDWRPGRPGYEERALAGVELGYETELTSTIELSLAAGRWESKDDADAFEDRGRLGIGWQPHPWFELSGAWSDIGTADDSLGLRAGITVPFGGADWSPSRWKGLGDDEPQTGGLDPDTIWDSVEKVGQIEVAERGMAEPDEAEEDDPASVLPLIRKSGFFQ